MGLVDSYVGPARVSSALRLHGERRRAVRDVVSPRDDAGLGVCLAGLYRDDGRTRVFGLDLGRCVSMGVSHLGMGSHPTGEDGPQHWIEFGVPDCGSADVVAPERPVGGVASA